MGWISQFHSDNQYQTYFQALSPAPELLPWVRYFWVIKWGKASVKIPELQLPDGLEEIIFSFDSPFIRGALGDSTATPFDIGSYIVGGKRVSLLCTRMASLSMIGIKFQPGTIAPLLNLMMQDVKGQTIGFSELGNGCLSELEARLFDAKDVHTIREQLNHSLLQWFVPFKEKYGDCPTLVQRATQILASHHGQCSIKQLTERLGVSPRQLQQQFACQVGMSPKALAGIFRFKRLYHGLQKFRAGNKAVAPVEFYDQSHQIKEFRKYLNASPSQWFANQGGVSSEVFDHCLEEEYKTGANKFSC